MTACGNGGGYGHLIALARTALIQKTNCSAIGK